MEVRPAVMHRLQSSFRIVFAPAVEPASDGRAASSTLGTNAGVCGFETYSTHTPTHIESKTHTLTQTLIRAAQLAKDASGISAILRLSLS
ncbi:MAG TPA: hypothetical protein VH250_13565 [Granulicella sp.]|jgi:hypothetical protein|nr:hypothetical protein [Granulicella sp.]